MTVYTATVVTSTADSIDPSISTAGHTCSTAPRPMSAADTIAYLANVAPELHVTAADIASRPATYYLARNHRGDTIAATVLRHEITA